MHVYRERIPFDLLDAGNVMYHPNYLTLCDRARQASLEAIGMSFKAMMKEKMFLAVVEVNSQYFRPAGLDDEIVILSKAIEATGASLTVWQKMWKTTASSTITGEEVSHATALYEHRIKLVSVKIGETVKACRLPLELLKLIEN